MNRHYWLLKATAFSIWRNSIEQKYMIGAGDIDGSID